MKHKQKKHKNLLHYTIELCWLKRRQERARQKLLQAIENCDKAHELRQVLLFASFLQDEPLVQQAYRKCLAVLKDRSAA